MITFLDENDVEYGALATIKATNAVNGERSITGTIVSGDYVLSKIERGWRLRFDDEYFVVTYAKPIDEGRDVQVSFDAVHQFFWDFGKSSVYDQLSDGSHTFRAYLDFIFNGSGYRYDIESSLTVKAFEKQSFGYKNRLSLFNDVITSSGVEFQVNGKVVRILAKVGTDLSTVVRKNFNLNELGIEKNIGNFVTYQKGFGAYFDEEDHSKGRLVAEYTSPLASVYGKLEADPLVDERYKQPESLLNALKETVDNSYTISVSLDMEDLTRAGYRYTQPVAGDYIMAINETLGFKEKIRIVSFTSEYDVAGQLIKHTVTCNDIGSVKKLSASYTQTQHQAANAEVNANTAYKFANKALVSANGKNTNYYGDTFPVDNPKGTLKKGDLLFLTVGDTVKQYYWNGAEWVTNPVVSDVEAFKEQIAEELKDVPNREEFENKISEEIANSKAEIETQIETAKTQAESNAKEYADTINQETAKVAELANAAADEIKADLVNVKNNLTATSLVANNAQAAVDAAKGDLTNVNTKVDNAKAELTQAKQQLTTVANDLSKAKTDLQNAVSAVDTKATNLQSDVSNLNTSLSNTAKALQTQGTTLANQAKELQTQASQLTEQAKAQETLTTRVENVEATANGTKTTVSELSKTVTQNGKDITSVSNRTKTVETSLTSAKTSISELQTSVSTAKTDLTNLTKRTKTVEDGLTGTKTNLSELTQTVSNDGKTIASLTSRTKTVEDSVSGLKTTMSSVQKDLTAVTTRTKTVEDDLSGTKTTLSQVQTTANSASQKTAALETGLNGLSAKFETLKIGSRNYFKNSKSRTYYVTDLGTQDVRTYIDGDFWQNDTRFTKDYVRMSFDIAFNPALPSNFTTNVHFSASPWYNCGGITFKGGTTALQHFDLKFNLSGAGNNYKAGNVFIRLNNTLPLNTAVSLENFNLYLSAVVEDYSQNEADLEQKVAEYKQNADQNYASLQTTVQNLDGTVQQNKTTAEQTAQGFKTRIESLETYKSGETTRANQYFESAKTETARQLTAERTAIAKDYVAKSTYTSDVTGVRNDLTATTTTANTTKTNLANYQASNDKAVANLQSNLQTANGNISSLKTKVEAVPGQITSAVSAVEGKIPKNIGGRNYIRNYGLTATKWVSLKPAWKFEIISDSTAKSGQYLKATCTTASTGHGGFYKNLFDFSDGRFFGKQMTWSMDVKTSKDTNITIGCEWGNAQTNVNVTENWQRFSKTFEVATSSNRKVWIFYGRNWEVGDIVYIRDVQLEDGSIATSPVPAIEDTQSDIAKLSSEIKQTKDGITLLATKTELSTAKSDLQSGITTATNKANNAQSTANSNAQTISTHTTQISALNTGLSAKVSQTDFNTLSGRVTTAENNITAKANELSSKITSVESKIPTSAGGRNYIKNSEYRKTSINVNDSQPQDEAFYISSAFWQNSNVYAKKIKLSFYYQPSVAYETERQFPVHFRTSPWPLIGVVTYPANTTRLIKYTIAMTDGLPANFKANQIFIRFSGKLDKGRDHDISKVMLEVSDVFSDWQPAPEDTVSQISSLSSQIKQTADGMTLLATKTELNSAKSDLQSGINTATNKANSAQSTANSAQNTANNNAQTISTHTTQISALNNGLSAKVSQTDFNALSGRVTNAENNITAKANELSSKITSVEGKIPTTVGGRNYALKTGDSKSSSTSDGKLYDLSSGFDDIADNATLIIEFDWRVTAPTSTSKFRINRVITYSDGTPGQWNDVIVKNGVYTDVSTSSRSGHYSGTFTKVPYKGKAVSSRHLFLNQTTTNGTVTISNLSVRVGSLKSDWSPAPEDAINQINSVSSELKQTTDSIKASVSSLDSSTVKSASLTINTDGIVMKAGKSTTDVANAIGSYFSVNQNAINLFSDKINVKGSMIVSGAITSDKIASKQINTAHLNGKIITADVISSNAVTADAIKAGAVTTDKMNANSINGDRITAGTLDAAKIKAGSITASQIASGTITSAQIKTGTISAANIAAGAITSDKIAANSIDASKIAANAITANMITGGQLKSTNGATVFDLNAGTLTFNNNYGYIQRVAGDKIFEITTYLGKSLVDSRDHLTSSFNVKKSDNSRQSGIQFSLYNALDNKPTATAKINSDSLTLYDSQSTRLFSVDGKNTWLGNFNMQGWGDIPVAQVYGGLIVKDIGIRGRTKSLLKIVDELCNKTGVWWT